MLATVAHKEGRQILRDLGLGGWVLGFDRAKRRAGQCNYTRKTITLSEYFVRMNEWDEVRNTILHEAAHALAGPGAGHGYLWAKQCRLVGIEPKRCYDSEAVNMPQGNVVVSCVNHGEVGRQHRMPKANARSYMVCRKCRTRLTYRKAYA